MARVLVIDDEPDVVRLVVKVLSGRGHVVESHNRPCYIPILVVDGSYFTLDSTFEPVPSNQNAVCAIGRFLRGLVFLHYDSRGIANRWAVGAFDEPQHLRHGKPPCLLPAPPGHLFRLSI